MESTGTGYTAYVVDTEVYQTGGAGLTWTGPDDWTAALSEAGVVHEQRANTDYADAATLTQGGSTYAPDLTDGLVGWWPLHGSGGTATDYSGQGNDGSVTGTTTGVRGVGGLDARSFDGTDDTITVSNDPSVDFGSTTDFTVSCWVYNRDTGGRRTIADHGDTNGAWWFQKQTDDRLRFLLDYGTSADDVYSTGALVQNEWTHLVAVADRGTELRLYENGVEDTTAPCGSSSISTTLDLTLGSQSANQYWDGYMADLRVYDRTLSDAEISTLYQLGAGDYDPLPAGTARYPLDGHAADVWGPNDGTVSGATYASADVGPPGSQAASFDGTDDSITATTNLPASAFSIAYWAHSRTPTDANEGVVAFTTGSSDLLTVNQRGDQTDDPYGPVVRVDSTFYDAKSTANTPPANEWRHEVVTYADGGSLTLYRNGAQLDSVGVSGAMDNIATLYLGTNDGGNNPFDGLLTDVRLYPRALSAAEIETLYRRTRTGGADLRDHLVRAGQGVES